MRGAAAGFERVRTQGETGPIEFEVYYKEHGNARPITYEVHIDVDTSKRTLCVAGTHAGA